MLVGLSHNRKNPDESYTILFGVWVWSRTPTRNLDPISVRYLDNGDDKWGEASTAILGGGAMDDKRLQAQQQIEPYQAQIFRAFNKKVKEQTFKKGDLVLAVKKPMVMMHKTKEKFQPKWERPFVVESV